MKKISYIKFSFSLIITSIILFGVWMFTFPYDVKESEVIKTNCGYVKGIKENGIEVYRGIPYASPPVGDLRFKAPRPCQPWKDTLRADKFGSVSGQLSNFTKAPEGNENCLLLNIFKPHIKAKKLPVLFWIHGGAMVSGSGNPYNGHTFADRDSIIVVTLNYRLGILGFTYLDDLGAEYAGSGNNGLLDCITALKWVKANIAAFGGDPERITIAGQSAGAKLCSSLVVSPLAKDLFSQYISESGGVQCIRDVNTAKRTRSKILMALGLKDNETRKLIRMPLDQLLKGEKDIANGTSGVAFLGPVNDNIVFQGDPYDYIGQGHTSIKAALIGNNKTEIISFFLSDKRLKKPRQQIFFSLFGDNAPIVMRNYHFQLRTQDSTSATIPVLSQYLYIMHSFRLANALSSQRILVYMYRFDYDRGVAGAGHGTELPFTWYGPLTSAVPIRQQIFEVARKVFKGGQPLAEKMHQAWASFIKTGNPSTGPGQNWRAYSERDMRVMLFNLPESAPVKFDTVFNDPNFPAAGFVLK